MKKLMMLGGVVVLLSLASSAQAQFAGRLGKALVNAAQLERNVGRAAGKIRPGQVVVRVSQAVVPGGKTVISAAAVPTKGNAVNASYLYKLQNQQARLSQSSSPVLLEEVAYKQAREFVNISNPLREEGFYEDQATLARDLNEFYQGSGVAVEAPDGKLAKLYALPADGILYKPVGYTEPVVLEAGKDFVVYYPESQTGQIVRDIPLTRELFSKPTNSGSFEEVTSVGGYPVNMPLGEPDWELLKGIKTEPAPQNDATEMLGDFEEVK